MSHSSAHDATFTARSAAASPEEFVARHAYLFDEQEMFLCAEQRYRLGERVRFELQLTDGEPVFRGTGRVVAMRHLAGGVPGATIRFEQLCPGSRAMLELVLEFRRGERTPICAIDPRALEVEPELPLTLEIDYTDESTARISIDDCMALQAQCAAG